MLSEDIGSRSGPGTAPVKWSEQRTTVCVWNLPMTMTIHIFVTAEAPNPPSLRYYNPDRFRGVSRQLQLGFPGMDFHDSSRFVGMIRVCVIRMIVFVIIESSFRRDVGAGWLLTAIFGMCGAQRPQCMHYCSTNNPQKQITSQKHARGPSVGDARYQCSV